jgi:DNA polymerase-3 subunit beta
VAGRAVGSTSGSVGLSGIQATLTGDRLELTGSDLDLTISAQIQVSGQSDGRIVIPAKLAESIVKSLPPGAVNCSAEDDELLISAGRSEFSIRLISANEFPTVGEADELFIELPADALVEAFKQVVTAASTDDSRPVLTGVFASAEADGLRLVATDSYRLAMRDIAGAAEVLHEGASVLIPGRALSELGRLMSRGDSVRMHLGEREARFEVPGARLSTRLLEGTFPNYRGLIPEHHPNVLSVDRSTLLEALKRVSLLARDNTPVRLEMSDDGLKLAAIAQDVGSAQDVVEASYSGTPLTIAFNPQFLREGLEVAPGDEVTLNTIDELKPALLRSSVAPDFLYLLMPVRVS